jgi:CheY-like chemotaxis protein
MQDFREGQGLRVLVADDDGDVADSLRILLELWGHQPRVARDGQQALDAALAFRPHVALLDFLMPKLTGGEVAARLRQARGTGAPVLVATTANAPDDPCVAPYNGHFDHYLRKPFNLEQLERLLAACAARVGL